MAFENSVLKCIFTSEGRIVRFDNNGSVLWKYEYNLKDHLGNTRIVFTAHPDGRPETNQLASYDPFGFVTTLSNWYPTGSFKNKFLYNGKELQDDQLGGVKPDWYDYGARFYDPQIGRWHSIDPLAEKYSNMAPYAYCGENPIKMIDPDGRKIVIAGLREYKETTFNDTQKLSSSNLIMLKSGQVLEASSYKGEKSNVLFSGKASGGKKEFGTTMIHDLTSNQKHTVTVKQGSDNDFLPTNGNYGAAQNPKQGVGGAIDYDPESTGSTILNKDGTWGVDAFIILGHELIHSDNAMKGKTLDIIKENGKYDPDSPSGWPKKASLEEIRTRKNENIIRSENKIKPRAIPE